MDKQSKDGSLASGYYDHWVTGVEACSTGAGVGAQGGRLGTLTD